MEIKGVKGRKGERMTSLVFLALLLNGRDMAIYNFF